MRRMRSWAPWILIAVLGVAAIASASVGAASEPSRSAHPADSLAHRADFCREMRSAVLAAQRLPHLVSKMGSESLRTAKASLLLNVSAMERPFRSLREVHGPP